MISTKICITSVLQILYQIYLKLVLRVLDSKARLMNVKRHKRSFIRSSAYSFIKDFHTTCFEASIKQNVMFHLRPNNIYKLATLQGPCIYWPVICLPRVPLDENRFFFLEEAGVSSPPLSPLPFNWVVNSSEVSEATVQCLLNIYLCQVHSGPSDNRLGLCYKSSDTLPCCSLPPATHGTPRGLLDSWPSPHKPQGCTTALELQERNRSV